MIVTSGYLKVALCAVALIATAYTVTYIARLPHEKAKKDSDDQSDHSNHGAQEEK
jgi:mannose/fructose/N-acetylgalactosamine-specific phosphotransferase system component IIC